MTTCCIDLLQLPLARDDEISAKGKLENAPEKSEYKNPINCCSRGGNVVDSWYFSNKKKTPLLFSYIFFDSHDTRRVMATEVFTMQNRPSKDENNKIKKDSLALLEPHTKSIFPQILYENFLHHGIRRLKLT